MATASNSAVVLSKQLEDTWGEVPVAPDFMRQRASSASFTLNRTELEDDSITSGRGIPSVRFGNQDASGTLTGNLAFDNYDALLASACMNDWVGDVLQSDGEVEKSFTFEIGRTDVNVYEIWTGVQVNTMSLTSPTDALTTITFDFNAKGQDSINATPIDADITNQVATEAMYHCGGVINYKGQPLAIITSIDLSLENGLENQFGWGLCEATDVIYGRSRVSGTLTSSLIDDTFMQDSLAELDVSIDFTLTDPEGNWIKFDIPEAKLGSIDAPVESEGPTVLTIPFRGQAASGPTLEITRFSAP